MQRVLQSEIWYRAMPVSIEGRVFILDVQSALNFDGDIRDGYISFEGRRALVTQRYPIFYYPSPIDYEWFLYRWLDS